MILALFIAAAVPISPYERRLCARELHPRQCLREVRISYRKCGPEGNDDWDDVTGPVCERWGWNGRRYVPFCAGSWSHPRRDDPWLWAYLWAGDTLRDAMIELSDNRTNTCEGKRR